MGLHAEAIAVVDAHRAAMRRFVAAGVATGVLEAGPSDAPVVLCLHGVPTSAFLYRKVIAEVAREGDGGRAFLRIMRGFELTPEKDTLYRSVVSDPTRPRQVLWGEHDPTLRLRTMGKLAADIAGVPAQTLPGRHFLQEDNAPAIADAVAALARQHPTDWATP